MSQLRLSFYGDDFTGSTDSLEQLTLAGIRTLLFIEPPPPARLKKFPGLQAIGVAGKSRALAPAVMEREIKPALRQLKRLGARHVHYKVCSTFDSSPAIGSIGRVMEIAAVIFPTPFIPLLVAAPDLGRYTVFGQHFARYGIGSMGAIHRLDRHPSVSQHPVTPMTEADLRQHLARQTPKRLALFDILSVSLPASAARVAFAKLLQEKPEVVLFDALTNDQLTTIGKLLDTFATSRQPLFSVGSSGIEVALAAAWAKRRPAKKMVPPASQILVGSGSCSPVTSGQIAWALKHGFAEVALDATALTRAKSSAAEIQRAVAAATELLRNHRSVIIHTTKRGAAAQITATLQGDTARILGTALGQVLRTALAHSAVRRIAIAGGDTSSYAARALGIEALEMLASLTPGAPLCRAHAPKSPADGCECVFKGGQVGAENYFATLINS